MITYSTSPASTPVRSSAERIAIEPSSVAGNLASPPPRRPNGVRTAETMTERAMEPAYTRRIRVLMVDNYDSFTYNLVHTWLQQLRADVVVRRSDEIDV